LFHSAAESEVRATRILRMRATCKKRGHWGGYGIVCRQVFPIIALIKPENAPLSF
jgi:hypothetical protein